MVEYDEEVCWGVDQVLGEWVELVEELTWADEWIKDLMVKNV